MKIISICLRGLRPVAIVAAATLLSSAATAQERIVSAHLMPQESIGAEYRNPDEGHLAPKPSDPTGVRALHTDAYLRYYRQPLAAAQYDIGVAKSAGINTFNMLLFPTELTPISQFKSIISAYWQEASADPTFKMDVDLWPMTAEDPDTASELASEVSVLFNQYPNAWRKHDGRYVVLLNLRNIKQSDMGLSILQKVLSVFGGRQNVYLVLYGPKELQERNPEFLSYADAFTDWPVNDYGRTMERIQFSSRMAHAMGKDYWYPIMPGFMMARPGIPTPIVREKLGFVSFDQTWRAAIRDGGPGVNVTTWNDLSEDSAVMPESNHSDAFVRLNAYYSGIFRFGAPSSSTPEQILLFHHPQTTGDLQLPTGRRPVASVDGPGELRFRPTDYVGVVAMLKRPTTVTIMFDQRAVASRLLPAGVTRWLIYYPNPGAPYASYLSGDDGLITNQLPGPINDTQIYVSVGRPDLGDLLFRSHRPIVDAAGRGDLTTVGDAFVLSPNP